jgi:hypothetical protein
MFSPAPGHRVPLFWRRDTICNGQFGGVIAGVRRICGSHDATLLGALESGIIGIACQFGALRKSSELPSYALKDTRDWCEA